MVFVKEMMGMEPRLCQESRESAGMLLQVAELTTWQSTERMRSSCQSCRLIGMGYVKEMMAWNRDSARNPGKAPGMVWQVAE